MKVPPGVRPFVLLMLALTAGCAPGTTIPTPELQQRIENARTRADHQALVAYYANEAASARASAEQHRKMANSYQGNLAGGRGGLDMSAHCRRLVESYSGVAKEYDGMAAAHRQLAERL